MRRGLRSSSETGWRRSRASRPRPTARRNSQRPDDRLALVVGSWLVKSLSMKGAPVAIVFEQIRGWFRPRIICDSCEQPISDVNNAMVVYEEPREGQDATTTRVLDSHKEGGCQPRVRAAVGQRGYIGMWDELANHLVM